MNKRILLSLGTLLVAGAVIAGGTGAFFSDTETSTGNVFTAGSVTLLINNIVHTYNNDAGNAPIFNENGVSFTLDDLKPLDEGSVDFQVLNGANEAYVCAMVTETGNADNSVVDPEVDLGDDGTEGELQDFLSFKFGAVSGTLADISGVWQDVGVISPSTPTNSVIDYCFGDYAGSSCVLSGDDDNIAQTDSVTADIEFYAVQTRNNPGFSCDDLNDDGTIGNDDLATSFAEVLTDPTSWLFYNDTDDTIMTNNQFSPAGTNEIATVVGRDAAVMILDDASARYNIATYQFSATQLSTISTLKYTIYDDSVSSQTPFLHFNVDFDNSDTWQRRLVHVPGASTNPAVPVGVWTEVDAIDGGAAMWTISGGNWPVGATTAVPFSGATARSWADIIVDYPTVALRTTDSFFGVRVGHPGPIGEAGYVDSIEFDGVVYDFAN